MARDKSDNVHDVGHLADENMLKNRSKSKYLDDVVEQTTRDYKETAERIEREKRLIDNVDNGFISSLDLSMHDKVVERAGYRTDSPLYTFDGTREREKDVNALLEASDMLLKVHRKASRSVKDASKSTETYTAHENVRRADQEHVQSVLAAGKRIVERDLAGVPNGAKGGGATHGENTEIAAQANELFGGRRKDGAENGDVERSLKYLEKGVKKMTNGLNPRP